MNRYLQQTSEWPAHRGRQACRLRVGGVLLLLAQACSPPHVPRHTREARLILPQDPDGFFHLAAYYTPLDPDTHISLRARNIAQNRTQLAALWRDYFFGGRLPEIDFETYVVLALTDIEPVGGCGVEPIREISLDTDGVLRPHLADATECHVVLSGIGSSLASVTRAIVIARSALPKSEVVLDWGVTRRTLPLELDSPTSYPVPQRIDAPPRGVSRQAGYAGYAQVPNRGDTTAVQLLDGDRAWVVRHMDGNVSVLAADFAIVRADVGTNTLFSHDDLGIDGYFVPTEWRPEERSFNGLFDEYGVAVYATMRNLDRYELGAGRTPGEIAIGSRMPGIAKRTLAPFRARGPTRERAYRSEEFTPLAPGAAVRQPSGTLVALAAGLIDTFDGFVRICDAPGLFASGAHPLYEPWLDSVPAECTPANPVALDVVPAPHAVYRAWADRHRDWPVAAAVTLGPLLARVSPGGFSHVVVIGTDFPF